MQVVRVEFVTHYNSAQEAVDFISQVLPDIHLIRSHKMGARVASWDIYSVDEPVTHMVSHPVEDGKVVKNHGV